MHQRYKTGFSINGGGITSFYSICLMLCLDLALDEPLYKYIDIYSGTSGGAIPVGITMPHPTDPSRPLLSPADYIPFYVADDNRISDAGKIFTPVGFQALQTAKGGPIYDGQVLEDIMHDKLGDVTTHDALTNILIPAISTRLDTLFFKNKELVDESGGTHDHNYYLYEVIRGATAAPYYFEPKTITSLPDKNSTPPYKTYTDTVLDAGLILNNPSLPLLSDLEETRQDHEKPMVINFGINAEQIYRPRKNLVSSLLSTIKIGMSSHSNEVKKQLHRKKKKGEIAYYNLVDNISRQELRDIGIVSHFDSTKPIYMNFLKEKAFLFYDKNRDTFQEIVDRLETERLLREQQDDARLITQAKKAVAYTKKQPRNDNNHLKFGT